MAGDDEEAVVQIDEKALARHLIYAQAQLPQQPRVPTVTFNPSDHNQEVGIFTRNYEIMADAQKWTDDMKAQYLPMFLKDEAITWYHRDATRKNKPWATVKRELQAHFRPTGYVEHRVAALHRRKLRDGESINDYHNAIMRMYDILEQCGKNYTEREKAQKMVRGLPINYRITMTLARVETPQEFLDAAGEIVDVLETKKRRDVGDGFDMPNDIPLATIFSQDSTRKTAWPFKENTRNVNQDRDSGGSYIRQQNDNAYRYGNETFNNTYRDNQNRESRLSTHSRDTRAAVTEQSQAQLCAVLWFGFREQLRKLINDGTLTGKECLVNLDTLRAIQSVKQDFKGRAQLLVKKWMTCNHLV